MLVIYTIVHKYGNSVISIHFVVILVRLVLTIIQNAAMELFDWLEDNHPMREDWNTVTMEHGLSFAIIIFMTKKL